MAKIIEGGVTLMYDVVENVKPAYDAMVLAGANVNYMED